MLTITLLLPEFASRSGTHERKHLATKSSLERFCKRPLTLMKGLGKYGTYASVSFWQQLQWLRKVKEWLSCWRMRHIDDAWSEGGLKWILSIPFVVLTRFQLSVLLIPKRPEVIRPFKADDKLLGRQDEAFGRVYDLPTHRYVPIHPHSQWPAAREASPDLDKTPFSGYCFRGRGAMNSDFMSFCCGFSIGFSGYLGGQ